MSSALGITLLMENVNTDNITTTDMPVYTILFGALTVFIKCLVGKRDHQ